MKLAIIGSRTFTDYDRARDVFLARYDDHRPHLEVSIVSGGAMGADAIGKKLAQEFSLEYTAFLPDWAAHGKAAGFMRNADIIAACDEVLAFWDGLSRGTAHSLGLAKKAKKPTLVIYF